jgi:ABC-type multidrug transport system fused ATPase/permease subunit
LSTVRNADSIYVLADGRVLESGRHDELMAKSGLYANMVRAQALE